MSMSMVLCIQNMSDTACNKLNQIQKTLEEVYQLRIIQHLCRPISLDEREVLVAKCQQKIDLIDSKLQQVICTDGNQTTDTFKSKYQELNPELSQAQRRTIEGIQNRSRQIFVEGSFKHMAKVVQRYGMAKEGIVLPNIEQWANQLLHQQKNANKCC